MASRKTLLVAAAMVLVAAAAFLPVTASRKTFTVGDDAGWNVGVDYKAWARGKTFKVGDRLVFRPKDKWLDVVFVDEKSFNDCVTPDNARVLTSNGRPYSGIIQKSGKYFFICDAEGACASGMKLAINVVP